MTEQIIGGAIGLIFGILTLLGWGKYQIWKIRREGQRHREEVAARMEAHILKRRMDSLDA